MNAITPDYRLDMSGEPCPYPAVATLEALPQLKKGEILEVISDCRSRLITFRWMPATTAIQCWISSRMALPSVISFRNNPQRPPRREGARFLPYTSVKPVNRSLLCAADLPRP